jgi:hypothetical protein
VDTSTLYPSKYVGSDDLRGNRITVTIGELKLEALKDRSGMQQMKPVLYFQNASKGLVVNKTNLKMLQAILGSKNSNDWIGRKVILYAEPVPVGNEIKMGIRVAAANGNSAAQIATPPSVAAPEDDVPDSLEPEDVLDDKIPF